MAAFTRYSSSDSTLTGNVDGTNTTYTVGVVANFPEVYKNGLLQEQTVNYTWDGNVTYKFMVPPSVGDDIQIWTYQQ